MRAGLAALALFFAAAAAAAGAPRSDALYRQMRSCLADPGQGLPCAVAAPDKGYLLLQDDDPAKRFAWLLVPTTDVTGIEDPAVFRAPVAGFWSVAWGFAGQLLPAPPEGRGLAINSKQGRTQNLLHIHISCIPIPLRDALARADIGPDWRTAPFVTLSGQAFNVRRVRSLDPSPFLLLRDLPGAAEDMAGQSLAVIGRAGGGFFLVTDSTERGVVAETEALLDESCAPEVDD